MSDEPEDYPDCRSCRHWEKRNKDGRGEYGECMRSPPLLFPDIFGRAPPVPDLTRRVFGLRPEHFYRPVTYYDEICEHYHDKGF